MKPTGHRKSELTPAGLIQDRHLDIIPERSLAFHQHNIYILDKAVITDPVISDIILYVLDQHIIPNVQLCRVT